MAGGSGDARRGHLFAVCAAEPQWGLPSGEGGQPALRAMPPRTRSLGSATAAGAAERAPGSNVASCPPPIPNAGNATEATRDCNLKRGGRSASAAEPRAGTSPARTGRPRPGLRGTPRTRAGGRRRGTLRSPRPGPPGGGQWGGGGHAASGRAAPGAPPSTEPGPAALKSLLGWAPSRVPARAARSRSRFVAERSPRRLSGPRRPGGRGL